ncbi:MAG TPA: hypothetical protein VJZ00_04500, partial [Thermoanaerobaculia bacterium]|nr:hypothetical protein [Thermoanaerobaculia bacterium]
GTPALHSHAPQELFYFLGGHIADGDNALELGLRLGDVLGRLDTILLADTHGDAALASMWRGWPIALGAHAFHADDDNGIELRAHWDRYFPQSRVGIDAGYNDFAFATAYVTRRQIKTYEAIRVDVDEDHYRVFATARYRSLLRVDYQHDGGGTVTLGGIASSVLPRSSYARRVLDPALPVAILSGRDYDGWRIETSVPSMPFTAFYQRHDLGGTRLSLAGARYELAFDPNPILKLPALDLTAGVAFILDGPTRHDTNWWLGLRWRP